MSEPSIRDYPSAPNYLGRGILTSVGLHFLLFCFVVGLTYLFHVRTLSELMNSSQFIPVPTPPPQVPLVLIPDNDQPPPTTHPEWVRQLIKPPDVPTPTPTPKPTPKPKPKPENKPQPKPVEQAPRPSMPPAELQVGSAHFPQPDYPPVAERQHVQGTVTVIITFDSGGGVSDVEIDTSSGSSLLDSSTRRFILQNWQPDPSFAGKVERVPIQYTLGE